MQLIIVALVAQSDAIPARHALRNAPVFAEAAPGLPTAEPLATPEVRTLLGYTRRALHLPDGHTMAVFSYSQSAPANWLFLVDTRDLSHKRFAIPNNDIASHAAALGADGRIYIMPYNSARAYRFDPATEAFAQLPSEVPESQYTWDALGAMNGRIYFGTWPDAYFGEYDPESGEWTLWPQVAPNTKYVTSFTETAEGHIRFRAWGPDSVWHTFDPATRALTVDAPPEAPRTEDEPPPSPPDGDTGYAAQIAAAGRHFGIGFPSGRFYELAGDEPVERGDTQAPAEPTWWLKATGTYVAGISYYGALFRYDLDTGRFRTSRVDNRAAGGNSIMFLETVRPDCVIGANYSQQNLFTVHPHTGAVVESPAMIARVPGEPFCAVGHGGKGYIGIYIHALLSEFDPDAPFEFGENPRELIELHTQYGQTRPRAAVSDGRFVYMTSDGDYNRLGGALTVLDPATGAIDVYPEPIEDQNLPTLAYDTATGLLWGGTDRWGQMHSHPPSMPDPFVYAFDPEARHVVEKIVVAPGADTSAVLGVSREGVLAALSGETLTLIHTPTRDVLYTGPSPIGHLYEAIPKKLRVASDGHTYGAANDWLYRWDFDSNRLVPVAHAPGCTFLTEPEPGLWLLADARTIYRVQL